MDTDRIKINKYYIWCYKKGEGMEVYILQAQNGKKVCEGSITACMKKLMKITKETGSIPEVNYDEEVRATCFEFEGYYCNFKLYLTKII